MYRFFLVFIVWGYLVYIYWCFILRFPVAMLYSLFSGQMSILTMLIQNFIYSFPPLLMLHIKCIWAPLILSFLHIRILLKRCVCWNRFHIHTFCDAMTLSTQNATGKIFDSFLVTRHACSLPLYLITNLFCEPCCYNFLNATKIVIESSRWNKRFCNSNIYIHYSKYITVTKMVRIKNKIGKI